MKSKRTMRAISIAGNILLFVLGSVVSLILAMTIEIVPHEGSVAIGLFALITFLLLLLILAVEIIAAVKIAESTMHTAVVAFFLLAYLLFSPDAIVFFSIVGTSYSIVSFEIAGNIAFLGLMFSLLVFFRYHYVPKRAMSGPTVAVAATLFVCALCYTVLIFINLQLIAHIAAIAAAISYFCGIQFVAYRNDCDDPTFAFSSAILFSCAGLHTVNVLCFTGLLPSSEGWTIAYSWLCLVCFIAIYVFYFIRTSRSALRAAEYKLQAEELKTKLLAEQMKPHFIFNSLTTVKSMYHHDVDEGDKAMGLFSSYLRESIEMLDSETIPFEQELENVERYVDFCNMSLEKKFNVIFDIDVTDFRIPACCVQPFVENAIKYSKVNELDDGAIVISSYLEGEDIVIRISDNGAGFDVSHPREGGYGIRNVFERFRLLYAKEPAIESAPGEGTTVTMRIRRDREEHHEDRSG